MRTPRTFTITTNRDCLGWFLQPGRAISARWYYQNATSRNRLTNLRPLANPMLGRAGQMGLHSESEIEGKLMARLSKRDPEALAAIYDRYARIVYSLFLRITHDQAAAEDLVQELFLRLWNRAQKFDSNKGALGVWLLSVARNMALDHVRSAPARFATRLLRVEQIEQLSYFGSFTEPESMIDRARAAAALSNLSSREKQVLELAYFEGYSQSEIANLLEEPLGTVKSWMRSGRTRLRLGLYGHHSTYDSKKDNNVEGQVCEPPPIRHGSAYRRT